MEKMGKEATISHHTSTATRRPNPSPGHTHSDLSQACLESLHQV